MLRAGLTTLAGLKMFLLAGLIDANFLIGVGGGDAVCLRQPVRRLMP
jgi:hypothetical protein